MTKGVMRARARARLAELSGEARGGASRQIARRVWGVEEVAGAGVIFLFASTPSEVETDAIAAEAIRRGMTVAYPRCLPETRAMVLHAVRALEELRETGLFGIREPDPAAPVIAPADVDVALVPGLAWDRAGGRLGRGHGYYDRFLLARGWRGACCGLFFSAQEFPRLPMTALDVPLDVVVTEDEVVRPRADGGGEPTGIEIA